ncbi:MAG: hypothetical protein V4671_13185, partial [Armatimonadota bacterium]
RPLLIVLPTVGALWFLLWVLLRRDTARSAVLTSALTFSFFSFAHMMLLKPLIVGIGIFFTPYMSTIPQIRYLFPLWAVPVVALILFILRTRRDLRPANRVLNPMSAALVALALLPLATDALRPHASAAPPPVTESDEPGMEHSDTAIAEPAPRPKLIPRLTGEAPTTAAPDIYFIVLDGYGRKDVLKSYYGFDNGPFVRGLEEQGFFVANKSRANYNQTVLCLAAALGMRYSDDLGRQLPPNSRDTAPLTDRVDRSPASAFLKARGYRYLAIATGFGMTRAASADILYENDTKPASDLLTPYEGLLINSTPLSVLPRVNRSLYDDHRDALNAAWRQLESIPTTQPARKFVFVHLLAPHPPFVFGSDGTPTAPDQRPYSLADASDFMSGDTPDHYRKGYVGQIQHVNRRTLEAISVVRKKSKVPPIIVVMGDHGPRMFLDYQSLPKSDVRECFGNLFAVHLPDGAKSAQTLFGDDISAVNTFRLLFDRQFGATFPRLPDRSYYSMMRTP